VGGGRDRRPQPAASPLHDRLRFSCRSGLRPAGAGPLPLAGARMSAAGASAARCSCASVNVPRESSSYPGRAVALPTLFDGEPAASGMNVLSRCPRMATCSCSKACQRPRPHRSSRDLVGEMSEDSPRIGLRPWRVVREPIATASTIRREPKPIGISRVLGPAPVPARPSRVPCTRRASGERSATYAAPVVTAPAVFRSACSRSDCTPASGTISPCGAAATAWCASISCAGSCATAPSQPC